MKKVLFRNEMLLREPAYGNISFFPLIYIQRYMLIPVSAREEYSGFD